jgi:hypothetical protein
MWSWWSFFVGVGATLLIEVAVLVAVAVLVGLAGALEAGH